MTSPCAAPEGNDPNQPPSEHKGHRGLWVCGGIVLLLVAATVYTNLAPSRALRVSRETTYITEPLKSDGKQVDYFAAIQQATCPANIATDDNGYRLIVQHLGRGPDSSPAQFACLCDQLGLDASAIRPDMTHEEPWDFLKAYVASEEFDKALLDALPPEERSEDVVAAILSERLDWPWTLDDLPMMARWLEENGPVLDLIGRAVQKPVFHVPLVRNSERDLLLLVSGSDILQLRSMAKSLSARANYRVGTGDLDGAIDDILACKSMARHVIGHPMSMSFSHAMAIDRIGDLIGLASSLAHSPSSAQLRRLLRGVGSIELACEVHTTRLFDRFECLDIIQSLAHGDISWRDVGTQAPRALTSLGVDWSTVAKRFNDILDEGLATGNWPDDRPLTILVAVRCISIHARSEYLADWLSLCLFSPFAWQSSSRLENLCRDQMKRITLAMLLYERDHGTLPPAWLVDAEGSPLHSWRVLLLPYLEQEALYAKIRLNEPWDSEHNRQFHGEDLAVYRCPSDPMATPGQTSYSVVVGPEMPFEGGQGKRLADFGPNSDDMILLVERSTPVGWMEPAGELSQEAVDKYINWQMGFETAALVRMSVGRRPANGIREAHSGGMQLGLRNGAVVSLSEEDTGDTLRNMLRGTNTKRDYY